MRRSAARTSAAVLAVLAAAICGGAPPASRARVEVQGLLSRDPIDRRAAAVAIEAMAGTELEVLSAEESQAAVGADADLRFLLGSDPAAARQVLRRRGGDFVLIVSILGGAGEREEVYGIASWPARVEARATLLRTLDGAESGSSMAVRSARSTRGPEDALDSALVQAVRAATHAARDRILAEAAEWPMRQLLRIEPSGPQPLDAGEAAASLERRLGRPVAAEASGAAVLLTVSPPHEAIGTHLQALGWMVVDRRPGWWTVAAAPPPGRSAGRTMELALALGGVAAMASVALAARRRWQRRRSP
jgi:hypothetical protein